MLGLKMLGFLMLMFSMCDAAELKNPTEDVYGNEGDHVTLTCEAEGHPAPAFSWSLDGRNLMEAESSLNVTIGTNAMYICTATNYLGNTTKHINVYVMNTNVMGAPSAITTPDPSRQRTTDADDQCHEELILSPPEVLEEYGNTVFVNCSSADNGVGMYWKVGETESPPENETSAVRELTLSDWNVTAECIKRLTETSVCRKRLKITVYQNPEEVILFPTKHAAALEGTQYELQCDVVKVAPVQHLTVQWYRGSETHIKTDNFTQSKATKGLANESSTLAVILSRADNGAQFRCEAQLDFGELESPPLVISSVHTVSVHYAAELKNQIEDVYGNEGDHVTLTCEAEGHPAPAFSWSLDGRNLMETESSLNVTIATNAMYICTATNYLGNTTKHINVYVMNTNVMGAPSAITTPDPSRQRTTDADDQCHEELILSPPEVLEEYGNTVFVNCSSADNGVGMYWKVGETESPPENETSAVRELTLSDWNVTAECIKRLTETSVCRKRLKITVYQNPEEVILFPTKHAAALEGTQYELQCDVVKVAPVQHLTVQWYRGSETHIKTDNFTQSKATKGLANESSTLAVILSRADNGAQFRCEAQLDFGELESPPLVISSVHTVSVHYAAELKNQIEDVYGNEGDHVTLTCEAEGHPAPAFSWSLDGRNLMETESSLNVTIATNAMYICTATNYLGNTTKHINVYVMNTNVMGAPSAITTPDPSRQRTTDADDQCHEELILSPPEVLEEYGNTVFVNCSSADNGVGMYWKVGETESPPENQTSAVRELTLSDWNVTAECIKPLTETSVCRKELKITVYQNPEEVILFPTKHAAALEGTQYELQCDVVKVAPVQHLTVQWYRGSETHIKTDNFTQSKATKGLANESSTLAVILSRADNGAQFRCEAQLDFGERESPPPVISSVHTVSVHYAAELKNQTEDVYGNEGDHVTLTCEAEGHPAPAFSWSLDGRNLMETESNLNVTIATNAMYICTATNSVGNTTKHINVYVMNTNVMGAPSAITTPDPSRQRTSGCPLVLTPAEIVVRFGDPASVDCSTSAKGFQSMGWEAPSGATTSNTNKTTWRVEKMKDWATKPLCYINSVDGQCYVMLRITLYKTPDSVSVSALDQGPMVEGTEYRLKCDITDVAPVQKLKVTWYRGNEAVHTESFNDTTEIQVNVSSTLRVTPKRDHDGELFRCEAELHLGPNGPERVPTETSSPLKAVVHYAPVFTGSYSEEVNVFRGDNVTFGCSAEGHPPPEIQWSYSPGVHVTVTTRGSQKTITVTRATSTDAGVYICDATNTVRVVRRNVTLVVKDRPDSPIAKGLWWLLIPLVFVVIFVVIVLADRWKKHGQYTFVPDKPKNDDSGIPMTPQSKEATV